MKDYLNNQELKEMLILNYVRVLVEHFTNGNVMTNEEKANLKRGGTFIKNTLKKMIGRLGEKEAEKFVKKYNDSRVIVITDSELKVLEKRKVADLEAAYEDNKEYFDLVEITMDMNCKNCNKCFKDCDLYKHFEGQEVIPFNEEVDLGNCKFSYRK